MKKEYLEKLKAAGSEKEAAEMIHSFNAGKELSLDELGGVSGGTGMGKNLQHYKDIIVTPTAYGQGLTFLMLTELMIQDANT